MFKKIFLKFLLITTLLFCLLAILLVWAYIYLPSKIIASKMFQDYISNAAKEYSNLDLKIENPKLITKFKPEVDFSVDKIYLAKDNNVLLELSDYDSSINFKNILNKEFKLNYLTGKNLVIKSDELLGALKIKPSEDKDSKPLDWKINLYDSKIKLDNSFITFKQKNNTKAEIIAKNVVLKCYNDYKALSFDLKSKIFDNKKTYANISILANNEIKLLENETKIDNLNVKINNSFVKIISKIDDKTIFVNAKSNKFNLVDIFSLINSNFIVENGKKLLEPLNNPSGSVIFDVNYLNNNLSGYILVNNTKANIKDLTNLPINIQKGKILISKDKISFVDLVGYYGKKKTNDLKIKGDIKDYYKSFDSNIIVDAIVTNEFLFDYLSPLISNTKLKVSSPSKTKIIYKAKNGIMDIIWLAKLPKGVEFTVNNSQTESTKTLALFDRAVIGVFNIKNNILDIKKINYYIANEIKRGKKITPILILSGKVKLSGEINNLGFTFGKPIPCEFLNIFFGDNTFKKGTIEGKLDVVYKNKIPYLDGDIKIDKTILPNQRLFIKSAQLKTDDNTISVAMDGGFKRIRYNFSGNMKNAINPPFIIKDMKLNIDDLDFEKLLLSMSNDNTQVQDVAKINSENDIKDDNYFFDTNLVRIENSNLTIKKGKYRELNFSDINATMTLDENGVFKYRSNRFNIADGISTLRGETDLKNLKHHIRLGLRDVDSNLMAKVLLNLDKEISGKAKGLLELNLKRDLKLNGSMNFEIQNGAIGKIGVVEYLLKIASVFRNPIVMISPSVIMDIVNIPEGKFDKISGSLQLKDNVATRIDIKSYAPTLSALVRGRFDMEHHDASIRIYTRFSTSKKSIFGFLRNISLNAIANKVKMNTKNDYNYYAAEISDLPQIDIEENKTQIFLTQIEGDIENNNYLSSLKKLK